MTTSKTLLVLIVILCNSHKLTCSKFLRLGDTHKITPTVSHTTSTDNINLRATKTFGLDAPAPTELKGAKNSDDSPYWEKVFDDEVAKHELKLNSDPSIKDTDKAVYDANEGLEEHSQRKEETFGQTHRDHLNSNKAKNQDDAPNHKNSNNWKITNKPFGFFKRNQNNRKKDEHPAEANNESANVATARYRHLNRHRSTPANPNSLHHHLRNKEEVKDSDDRKRLPRHAAWFVQAALRMCETGQDPRCKKISVRRGNVKINIKIAEE